MRPNTKENSENKQKCQYNDETIISQAVHQAEDRPKSSVWKRVPYIYNTIRKEMAIPS